MDLSSSVLDGTKIWSDTPRFRGAKGLLRERKRISDGQICLWIPIHEMDNRILRVILLEDI